MSRLYPLRKSAFDELKLALCRPEWKGTDLYLFQQTDGNAIGRWSKLGSFAQALYPALPEQIGGVIWCNSDQELLTGWEDDDIPLSQACLELVAGDITRPDCAHQYAYAIEKLCIVLGMRLATIEGKRGILSHVGLDTRLCEERSPVDLPVRDDFPVISYLTAEEVQAEVAQLGRLDLSFPSSPEIEEDRRTLFDSLQRAAGKRLGVLAFYY